NAAEVAGRGHVVASDRLGAVYAQRASADVDAAGEAVGAGESEDASAVLDEVGVIYTAALERAGVGGVHVVEAADEARADRKVHKTTAGERTDGIVRGAFDTELSTGCDGYGIGAPELLAALHAHDGKSPGPGWRD